MNTYLISSIKRNTNRDLLKGVISNDFEWPVNIQWHEASRSLSATAELLVTFSGAMVKPLFRVRDLGLSFTVCWGSG